MSDDVTFGLSRADCNVPSYHQLMLECERDLYIGVLDEELDAEAIVDGGWHPDEVLTVLKFAQSEMQWTAASTLREAYIALQAELEAAQEEASRLADTCSGCSGCLGLGGEYRCR